MAGKAKGAGRPSAYSEAVAEAICDRLAARDSMRKICADADMPDRRTVERWMKADPEFAARCARAREEQAEAHHEEMDDIEAKTLAGTLNPQAASVVLANKRWRMEKLKPKVYGAKIQQELSGPDGGPIPIQAIERRIIDPANPDT